MKKSRLFIVSSLAMLLGVGAFGAIKATQEKELAVKTEAWGPRVDISFYVAYSGSYSVKLWYNAGYDLNATSWATKLDGVTYNGVQLYQANIQSSSEQSHYFNDLQVQLFSGDTWQDAKIIIGDGWKQFTNDGKIFVYEDNNWKTYNADAYRIKCGSGSYVTMTYDDGGALPSGLIGQYSATLNVTAGQSLTVQRSVDGSWSDLSPTYSGGNNNYYDNKILVSVSSASIFLKLSTGGTFDVWVPGYTSCAVVVGSTQYTTTQDGEQYYTTLVNIDKDQTIKVSWAHVVCVTYLNPYSTGGCFSESGGTITCLLSGAYTIYVQYNDYHSEQNTLYIERNNASTAKYLAQKFNSAISTICSGITGGTKSLSDLQAAWGSTSSSTLYKHFNGQPSDIKAFFSVGSGSSDPDITACVERYDYIELKYGTNALPDFLGRNNGYKPTPQSATITTMLNINNESVGTTIVIVVITSVCLVAVGGYFLFKKKKD